MTCVLGRSGFFRGSSVRRMSSQQFPSCQYQMGRVDPQKYDAIRKLLMSWMSKVAEEIYSISVGGIKLNHFRVMPLMAKGHMYGCAHDLIGMDKVPSVGPVNPVQGGEPQKEVWAWGTSEGKLVGIHICLRSERVCNESDLYFGVLCSVVSWEFQDDRTKDVQVKSLQMIAKDKGKKFIVIPAVDFKYWDRREETLHLGPWKHDLSQSVYCIKA